MLVSQARGVAPKASAPLSSKAQLAGNAALQPVGRIASSILKQLDYSPASILMSRPAYKPEPYARATLHESLALSSASYSVA